MGWKPPEEIGDALLIAAGALTVALIWVLFVTLPPFLSHAGLTSAPRWSHTAQSIRGWSSPKVIASGADFEGRAMAA
jgi:hypothetical protein